MRILYFGVFDGKIWRSEYPMLLGLQRAGHQVFTANFRSRIPGTSHRAWKRYGKRVDLVFIQNGQPFSQRLLSRFNCPVVYLASEYALGSARHILDAARPPNLVLAHSEQVVDYCNKKGIAVKRVHHAYHPGHYVKKELPYVYDLCFVGGLNPRRREWLAPFQQKWGARMFVGEVWEPEKINQIYNASKIVLHLHAADQSYVPTRFFEVLPTQGCLVTEKLGKNLTQDLTFKGFCEFDSIETGLEQINTLLENEDQRQSLVSCANSHAGVHNWHGRMQEYSQIFESLLRKHNP